MEKIGFGHVLGLRGAPRTRQNASGSDRGGGGAAAAAAPRRGRAAQGLPGRRLTYFSRWATPSRSSSSSASVPSIFSRENASISRPSMRLYSPFSHTTGTP